MALVRVCDHCRKLISDCDYINIEYIQRENGSSLGSRITVSLCPECFERQFGTGSIKGLVKEYKVGKE